MGSQSLPCHPGENPAPLWGRGGSPDSKGCSRKGSRNPGPDTGPPVLQADCTHTHFACGCFHTTPEVRDGKSLPTRYRQQGQTTAVQPPLTVGHYSNTCARLILAATPREVLCRSSTPAERPKTARFLKRAFTNNSVTSKHRTVFAPRTRNHAAPGGVFTPTWVLPRKRTWPPTQGQKATPFQRKGRNTPVLETDTDTMAQGAEEI